MARVKPQGDSVATTSVEFDRMCNDWELPNDLLGGTSRMREKGIQWLPKEEGEKQKLYKVRLNRSFLFNAFEDTCKRISSKPFSRPINITGRDEAEEQGLIPNHKNVDKSGSSDSIFFRSVLFNSTAFGLSHVFVDYPAMPNGGDISLAEEREIDARPFFTHVKPYNMLFWRASEAVDGSHELEEIRFREVRVENRGIYGDVEVDYIRVITKTGWQLWRADSIVKAVTGEGIRDRIYRQMAVAYQLEAEGSHSFGSIPLVTYYTNKQGFMTALPPLRALSEINLAHWQSSSDQRNILRFSRLATLFAKGFTDTEIKDGIIWSVNNLIHSRSENADVKFVEHSGRAIAAGQIDLDKLEKMMQVLGTQPFIERTGDSTATEAQIQEGRVSSDVQAWVNDLNTVGNEVYELAAQWKSKPLPTDFKVNIFNDFNAIVKGHLDAQTLTTARENRDLSQTTYLSELQRRAILDEDLNIEDEVKTTKSERDSAPDNTGNSANGTVASPNSNNPLNLNDGGGDDG